MSNFYNSTPYMPTNYILASLQASQSQAADDQEQKDQRLENRDHESYNTVRALTHARTQIQAEKEAIAKGQSVARTKQSTLVKEDSMKSAGLDGSGHTLLSAPTAGKDLSKPAMPEPSNPFGSSDPDSDSTNPPNVMAILARVLVLVANVQSQGWKTFWQMGNENINTSLQMSVAEADQTEQQYKMQASATKTQASQMKQDGLMEFGTFAVCAVMGAFGGPAEEQQKAPTDDPAEITNDTVTPARIDEPPATASSATPTPEDINGADEPPANNPVEQEQVAARNDTIQDDQVEGQRQTERVNEEAAQAEKTSKWGAIRKWAVNAKEQLFAAGSKVSSLTTRIFGNGWKYAQFITPGATGFQHLTIDAPLLSKKAGFEGLQGQFAAGATIARAYGDYNHNIFGRTEEIRQGASQNIDYAMQILKSASDSITQAVSSMAR